MRGQKITDRNEGKVNKTKNKQYENRKKKIVPAGGPLLAHETMRELRGVFAGCGLCLGCGHDDARASAAMRALYRLHALVWGRCGVWRRGGSTEGAGNGGGYAGNKS